MYNLKLSDIHSGKEIKKAGKTATHFEELTSNTPVKFYKFEQI